MHVILNHEVCSFLNEAFIWHEYIYARTLQIIKTPPFPRLLAEFECMDSLNCNLHSNVKGIGCPLYSHEIVFLFLNCKLYGVI